jgi:NitT/TauT family transport system substrate-binding protein
MKHSIKRALLATAAAATAVTLAACTAPADPGDGGDFEPLTEVSLQLQWLPQAQFAGYYVALDQGYFEEEGFDSVDIVPSGGDIVPQDALVAGDVDFAIAWVPKVLGTLEASGVELTNIAQVFQKSGTLQVSWADSGIESVADFEGKRIGSWGFGNEWEIFAAMADEGLDSTTVSITTQDFSMNALLDGDVDAAQAMTYNEWAQVLEVVNPDTGELYQPEDFNVISYEDTAGAMLQDAIWADTARLDDPAYADAAVRFLKAIIKGWVYARDNPERGQQADLGRWRLRPDRRGCLGQDRRGCARGDQPGRPAAHHHRTVGLGVLERVHRAGARRTAGG